MTDGNSNSVLDFNSNLFDSNKFQRLNKPKEINENISTGLSYLNKPKTNSGIINVNNNYLGNKEAVISNEGQVVLPPEVSQGNISNLASLHMLNFNPIIKNKNIKKTNNITNNKKVSNSIHNQKKNFDKSKKITKAKKDSNKKTKSKKNKNECINLTLDSIKNHPFFNKTNNKK